ncbi:hypothetical protein BJ165DRAFT_402328 [Panaeolus papilionaceus]|nr:hypothetical protein BJ165DRAFT_402328 [Panaeolus papilionaceus]
MTSLRQAWLNDLLRSRISFFQLCESWIVNQAFSKCFYKDWFKMVKAAHLFRDLSDELERQ